VHELRVDLVGNDHMALGPSQSLEVKIPSLPGAMH
jgi:hypothetical protein